MTDQGQPKKKGIRPIAGIAIGVLAMVGLGALGDSNTSSLEDSGLQPESHIPGTVNPLEPLQTPDPVISTQEKKTETKANTKQEKPTASESACHPSYSGCLDKNASDYDCEGGSGNGPKYTGPVRVIGPDVFGLDKDHDGMGCE